MQIFTKPRKKLSFAECEKNPRYGHFKLPSLKRYNRLHNIRTSQTKARYKVLNTVIVGKHVSIHFTEICISRSVTIVITAGTGSAGSQDPANLFCTRNSIHKRSSQKKRKTARESLQAEEIDLARTASNSNRFRFTYFEEERS